MLATPCAVVDGARLDANVAHMAELADAAGVALRPHAKTHKTAEVARRQLDSGAVGLTVATLHEAGVFAAAGIGDAFVAFPVWAGGANASMVRELHDTIRLRVGVDSVEGAAALGAAVEGSARPLQVLVELDSGLRRSGIAPEDAPKVAAAARDAGLVVAGVFTHGGHAYASTGAATHAADDEVRTLAAGAAALREEGHDVWILSAGSTPTASYSARKPVTELRPGTYVFGDAAQVELGACGPEDVALHVHATVVSSAVPGQVVIDAGSKSLSSDRRPWQAGYGVLADHPGCVVERLSEEHGIVTAADGAELPRVGDVVRVVPNHACAVANLAPELLVVDGHRVVDRWPVIGRR